MRVSLSDIPVNPYTASELVRLCLRRQDVEDQSTSNTSTDTDLEEEVVRAKVKDGLIVIFSSPELRAQARFFDRPLSVCLSVRLLLFQFSSRIIGPILSRAGTNHP
jgi:hypothetical protein